MKQLVHAALLGSLLAGGSAFASVELANTKQCMQCHKAKEDFAGPSFHKIAVARKGEPDAIKRMTATIRQGSASTGGPHWGEAKMPDQSERPMVSEKEAKALAKWILKQ
jgi:cytochrome c